MLRSVGSKVAWVGRTASMVFGLALVLALMFGMATMALGDNGDFFKVGRANIASAVSTLDKSGAGPALRLLVDSGAPLAVNSTTKVANLNADRIDNREASSFANSTHAHAGEAITSGTVEADRIEDGSGSNLNADQLDGQDSTAFLGANAKAADADELDGRDSSQFLPNSTYTKTLAVTTNGSGSINGSGWSCDVGDVLLSGGGKLNDADKQEIVQDKPLSTIEWFVSVKDETTSQGVGFEITVLCGDLGTPHAGS